MHILGRLAGLLSGWTSDRPVVRAARMVAIMAAWSRARVTALAAGWLAGWLGAGRWVVSCEK